MDMVMFVRVNGMLIDWWFGSLVLKDGSMDLGERMEKLKVELRSEEGSRVKPREVRSNIKRRGKVVTGEDDWVENQSKGEKQGKKGGN